MSKSTTPTAVETPKTSYDEIPYPSSSFPKSHPKQIAGMARLFGVDSPLPSKSRVLELGCADGANILPMAEGMPGAKFLGIDNSRVQIATGQKAAEAADLKNVELRHQDILDFPASEGKFDYIIVHGILSWVAEPVREKIMAICSQHLSEKGIAYISYNVLPGWNMRKSLRDMMLFHTAGISEPLGKVKQARALVKFLSSSVPTENNAYGILLKSELDSMSKMEDTYLLYDYLEKENTPFYFHEFLARAARHGLQYMSETSLSQMLPSNFPESVSKTLTQVGQIMAQEQYMDFLRNRMFRQTLICRASVPLSRNVSSDRLRDLSFQSLLNPSTQPVDLTAGVAVSFASPGGQQITTDDTFLKSVFQVLGTSGTRALSFKELLASARALARPKIENAGPNQNEIEDATLSSNLMNLYTKGLVEIHAEPVEISLKVADKPKVGALARYQAMKSRHITNRIHAPIPADALGRTIIAACDGNHSFEELLELVIKEVKENRLNVKVSGNSVKDDKKLRELLEPQVRGMLELLARSGFFAA